MVVPMWWLVLVAVCEAHEPLIVAGEAAALAVAVVQKAGGHAQETPLKEGCQEACNQTTRCALTVDHPACSRVRLEELWNRHMDLLMTPVDSFAPLSVYDYMSYLGDLTEARRRHCSVPRGNALAALANLTDENTARQLHVAGAALAAHLSDASAILDDLALANGTYAPPWCLRGAACATLLTEDVPEALVVAAMVRRWRLRARVHVVRDIRRAAHLGPSVLCMGPQAGSVEGRVQLTPPPCLVGDESCPFEPRRLPKLASWGNLLPRRRITEIITRLHLTREQYDDLAALNAAEGREQAAQAWLVKYEAAYQSWVKPGGLQMKVDAATPLAGDMFPAIQMAEKEAEHIAARVDFTLKTQAHRVGCDPYNLEKMLTAAMLSRYSLAAVVPACFGAAAAVRAAPSGLTVAVADVGADSAARVVRAGGARRALAEALWATMAALQWERATMLTEGEADYAVRPYQARARILHIQHLSALYNDTEYDTIAEWAMASVRAEAKLVIVGAESEALVRAARRAAAEAGLTATWLLAGASGAPAADGDLMVAAEWERTDLQPTVYELQPEWRERYSNRCTTHPCASPPSARAALLFDTIMLVFEAIGCVFGDLVVTTDALRVDVGRTKFKKCILRNNFTGITGLFRFDDDLTRQIDVDVYQWQNASYAPVGLWRDGRLTIETDALRWPDGERPTDGDRCDLDAWLRGRCGAGAVVGTGVLLALAAMLAALYVRAKRRAERRCATLLRQAAANARTDPAAPDEWELPRSRVVINRCLGKGAFGAVYGGHALLDGTWTAVAVKTLRAGACVEQKLEFLSEAETMKRLRHQNVVRLLGVVTASEPACLVQALQALGDLRGFLLARRGEGAGVGVRRLNRWALQAARALAYLRRQRVVHRDVAARNCLLSACRTLRLADFGMARPCGDGDYYRFGRKGMLPVRWMAPESVCLGVFSPASDVWSFGVLLYEMVTFGALPFQGCSNAQVLEQVKAGRTVPLPPGLAPHLEGLMRSCWRRAREARPPAAEIAAFLADHPKLLTPCLGPPPSLPFPAPQYSQCAAVPDASIGTDLTELSEPTETDTFLEENTSDHGETCHFSTEKR